MQDGVQFQISGAHLIVMYGQMGIELAGNSLEQTIVGGEHFPGPPTGFNSDTSEVRSGSVDNVSQTSSGASHNQSCTSEVRRRDRQFHGFHFWKQQGEVQRLAKANGEIPCRAFRRADI